MVEFGCVGAEIKWDTVLVLWFCGCGCGLVLHRKIRPTQLWVELSWVVAIISHRGYLGLGGGNHYFIFHKGTHNNGEKVGTTIQLDWDRVPLQY